MGVSRFPVPSLPEDACASGRYDSEPGAAGGRGERDPRRRESLDKSGVSDSRRSSRSGHSSGSRQRQLSMMTTITKLEDRESKAQHEVIKLRALLLKVEKERGDALERDKALTADVASVRGELAAARAELEVLHEQQVRAAAAEWLAEPGRHTPQIRGDNSGGTGSGSGFPVQVPLLKLPVVDSPFPSHRSTLHAADPSEGDGVAAPGADDAGSGGGDTSRQWTTAFAAAAMPMAHDVAGLSQQVVTLQAELRHAGDMVADALRMKSAADARAEQAQQELDRMFADPHPSVGMTNLSREASGNMTHLPSGVEQTPKRKGAAGTKSTQPTASPAISRHPSQNRSRSVLGRKSASGTAAAPPSPAHLTRTLSVGGREGRPGSLAAAPGSGREPHWTPGEVEGLKEAMKKLEEDREEAYAMRKVEIEHLRYEHALGSKDVLERLAVAERENNLMRRQLTNLEHNGDKAADLPAEEQLPPNSNDNECFDESNGGMYDDTCEDSGSIFSGSLFSVAGGGSVVQGPLVGADVLSGAVAAVQRRHKELLESMQAEHDARTSSLADKVAALESKLSEAAAAVETAKAPEAQAQAAHKSAVVKQTAGSEIAEMVESMGQQLRSLQSDLARQGEEVASLQSALARETAALHDSQRRLAVQESTWQERLSVQDAVDRISRAGSVQTTQPQPPPIKQQQQALKLQQQQQLPRPAELAAVFQKLLDVAMLYRLGGLGGTIEQPQAPNTAVNESQLLHATVAVLTALEAQAGGGFGLPPVARPGSPPRSGGCLDSMTQAYGGPGGVHTSGGSGPGWRLAHSVDTWDLVLGGGGGGGTVGTGSGSGAAAGGSGGRRRTAGGAGSDGEGHSPKAAASASNVGGGGALSNVFSLPAASGALAPASVGAGAGVGAGVGAGAPQRPPPRMLMRRSSPCPPTLPLVVSDLGGVACPPPSTQHGHANPGMRTRKGAGVQAQEWVGVGGIVSSTSRPVSSARASNASAAGRLMQHSAANSMAALPLPPAPPSAALLPYAAYGIGKTSVAGRTAVPNARKTMQQAELVAARSRRPT
ncbi:hypothetical protein FOA52_015129 [Chlamydomonas sp. UWO 241]|nr:hypothetical protein FOA52_015129 [Chlamydomonas sp. UWO 241]